MQKDKSAVGNKDKLNPPVPSCSPTSFSSSPLPQRSPVKATSLEHKLTSKRKSSLSEEMDNKKKRMTSTEEGYNQETILVQKEIIESQTEAERNGQKKDEKGKSDHEKEKERRVIIMKGSLPNLALPDGWIALNHRSGGIIYLHRQTRVCTWSRPYFIGGGSVRKHDVPVAAIPCFHQRRALSQYDEGVKDVRRSPTRILKNGASVLNALNITQKNGDFGEIPNERVETETDNSRRDKSGVDVLLSVSNSEMVSERDGMTDRDGVTEKDEIGKPTNLRRGWHVGEVFETRETQDKLRKEAIVTEHFSQNGIESSITNNTTSRVEVVDSDELGVYLSRLWEFQLLSSEQEQNAVDVIQPEVVHELELPASLECLPYSVRGADSGKQHNKEWKLRTIGKTPVAILHEFCQRSLKTKPIYLLSECDNPDSPFIAEVEIDGIKYGSGTASSKKVARQIAAEGALEVLVPGKYQKIRDCQISKEELEFFDKVDILDPRVFDFCSKTSLPTPSQLLEECLKRNQGISTSPIQFTTVCGLDKTLSFEITCGQHAATGPCKNKRIGKQLASQAILKKLHPHLDKWGGLLRIYCDRPTDSIKKYKKDDSDTFGEKDDVGSNALPNSDTLECLKQEMRKLHTKFIPQPAKSSHMEARTYEKRRVDLCSK